MENLLTRVTQSLRGIVKTTRTFGGNDGRSPWTFGWLFVTRTNRRVGDLLSGTFLWRKSSFICVAIWWTLSSVERLVNFLIREE
jgi:hypothetical protein